MDGPLFSYCCLLGDLHKQIHQYIPVPHNLHKSGHLRAFPTTLPTQYLPSTKRYNYSSLAVFVRSYSSTNTPFGLFTILFPIPSLAVTTFHFVIRTIFAVISNSFLTAFPSLYPFHPFLSANNCAALSIKNVRSTSKNGVLYFFFCIRYAFRTQ